MDFPQLNMELMEAFLAKYITITSFAFQHSTIFVAQLTEVVIILMYKLIF
jgi:hypothetical protein